MPVEIISGEFRLEVYGFSGTAIDKNYAGTAFKLMDKMWAVVKSNGLKNKGLNIWVYDVNDAVFAGVELYDKPDQQLGLEKKDLVLNHYAYLKHVGPYHQIGKSVLAMKDKLQKDGLEMDFPYFEIYGHHVEDEMKQETELFMNIKK